MTRTGIACALLFALGACSTTAPPFQPYDGKTGAQVVVGQGGTRETVDGIEFWGTGSPPRRYQVLGVASAADFDNLYGNTRILSAVADQVKQVGGDAAIAIDAAGDAQTVVGIASPIGAFGTGVGMGKKTVHFEVVKYLDKAE